MKRCFFIVVLNILLISCSNKEHVEISFEPINSYPIQYSYQIDSVRKQMKITDQQRLCTKEIEKLLPADLNLANRPVFALHEIKAAKHYMRIYLVKGEFAAWIINGSEDSLFYDNICVVAYDQNNNITSYLYKFMIVDDYGSYDELAIISKNEVITRRSDWEFSPDAESEERLRREGYVFHPDVTEKHYVLDSPKLRFEVTSEKRYPDPYYPMN